LLEFLEKFRNPLSFCDAHNNSSIDKNIESFRTGPTKFQAITIAIPWTAGSDCVWLFSSEEGALAPSPGLAYNEYHLSTKKYTRGHKKIQRMQKVFLDSRPNERTSLTLQRYLNDSEDLFLGRPDTGSESMVLALTATDQVLSNMTKNHSLSSQSLVTKYGSKLRRPSWGDCVVVSTLVKDSPLAVQARDFIFKHRNILRDGIFWIHSNIDPGLKDSFLDISIRSIEQPQMKSLVGTRFLHLWSRNFCESLSSRSSCIGVLAKPNVIWFLRECMHLASAIEFLHGSIFAGNDANKIEDDRRYGWHGDLKPENILCFAQEESHSLEDKGHLLIADFGLMDFHEQATRSDVPARHVTGSLTYKEPELILHWKVSCANDTWSLGVTRRSGFGTENQRSLSSRAAYGETVCTDWGHGLPANTSISITLYTVSGHRIGQESLPCSDPIRLYNAGSGIIKSTSYRQIMTLSPLNILSLPSIYPSTHQNFLPDKSKQASSIYNKISYTFSFPTLAIIQG
jgi:hypothetical protein